MSVPPADPAGSTPHDPVTAVYLRIVGTANDRPNEQGLRWQRTHRSARPTHALLAILQADGRRSYAELGAELGMAGPSAHERVKKLESRGVIRGYAADVDPAAVGLTCSPSRG